MTFPSPQEKPARRLNYAEKLRAGLVERKPRARLNPVAKWRVARNAEYSKLRGEFLAENPVCQVTGCREQSCDVHHKARRGKFLLRADTFLACCRPHHQQIEENPDWAKSQGYLLTPEQRRRAGGLLVPYEKDELHEGSAAGRGEFSCFSCFSFP